MAKFGNFTFTIFETFKICIVNKVIDCGSNIANIGNKANVCGLNIAIQNGFMYFLFSMKNYPAPGLKPTTPWGLQIESLKASST